MKSLIHMRDGTSAQLKGSFNFESGESVNIYVVDENKAYSPEDKNTVCYTPTSTHKSRISYESFEKNKSNGINNIVIHKDLWNIMVKAEEMDFYSELTDSFYETMDALKEAESANLKKKTIKEKTNMATDKKKNSTLNMMKEAGVHAVKQVSAGEANEILAKTIIKGLKAAGVPDKYVDSQLAQLVIRVLGPAGLHYIAETQEEMIDSAIGEGMAEKIRGVCGYATESVAVDYVKPAMSFVIPMLKELASADGLASLMNEDTEVAEKSSKKAKVSA